MSAIKISNEEREVIALLLKKYCSEHFDLNLGQFDADFFVDFIAKDIGSVFFNAGIDESIRTHAAYSERIQEEIDLKRIL